MSGKSVWWPRRLVTLAVSVAVLFGVVPMVPGEAQVAPAAGDAGDIETFAGTTQGYSGDGGPAEDAQLNRLINVEAALSGEVFIADAWNQVIRRVSRSGVIYTYAGTGVAGYGAEPVDRSSAQFNEPRGMATDAAGNLHMADSLNHRVRKIEQATGLVTTVAGTGAAGFGGDGGPATAAQLSSPKVSRSTPSGTCSSRIPTTTVSGVWTGSPVSSRRSLRHRFSVRLTSRRIPTATCMWSSSSTTSCSSSLRTLRFGM